MKVIIFILLLFLFSSCCDAKVPDIIICGKISPASRDTLQLVFKREFIYNIIGVENYTTVCDSSGYFAFHVKGIEHPAKISLKRTGGKALLLDHYVEGGDSIFISFVRSVNGFEKIFSGRGFEKFYCKDDLENKKNTFRFLPTASGYSKDPMVNKFAHSIKWSETLEDSLLHVLSEYREKVSPAMYRLFQSDVIGQNRYEMLVLMTFDLANATLMQKDELHSIFKAAICGTWNSFKGSVYSDDYIQSLSLQTGMQFEFVNGRRYSLKECYEIICKNYRGQMRERMLASCLLRGGKSGVSDTEYEYCLNAAMKIISNPVYKEYLQNQLKRMQKGSAVYDFSLADTTGKIFTPADFRGKVVLLDFWFTGCFACTLLSEAMEKNVTTQFADSSVVFVSVGVDKDRETWMKGIRSGKYTGSRCLNLFAGGPAMGHPFVKYYNIMGCPRLLLMDRNGNIYSSNPSQDPSKLCAIIKEALQESRQ